MSSKTLKQLYTNLQEKGFHKLKYNETSISGMIDVDTSGMSKSVPDGENTGPFATLDKSEEAIPDEIVDLVNEKDCSVSVLGHNPTGLHIRITAH